jgi:hypothetical protein
MTAAENDNTIQVLLGIQSSSQFAFPQESQAMRFTVATTTAKEVNGRKSLHLACCC